MTLPRTLRWPQKPQYQHRRAGSVSMTRTSGNMALLMGAHSALTFNVMARQRPACNTTNGAERESPTRSSKRKKAKHVSQPIKHAKTDIWPNTSSAPIPLRLTTHYQAPFLAPRGGKE